MNKTDKENGATNDQPLIDTPTKTPPPSTNSLTQFANKELQEENSRLKRHQLVTGIIAVVLSSSSSTAATLYIKGKSAKQKLKLAVLKEREKAIKEKDALIKTSNKNLNASNDNLKRCIKNVKDSSSTLTKSFQFIDKLKKRRAKSLSAESSCWKGRIKEKRQHFELLKGIKGCIGKTSTHEISSCIRQSIANSFKQRTKKGKSRR